MIWRLLPNIRHTERAGKIDYLGVVTLTLGLVPLLIGFTVAETTGFGDPFFWLWAGAGLVFLAIFVLVERRSPEPVIPLHLFRNRTFSSSMLSIFFATFGFGAVIIFLPFYFLIVAGRDGDRVRLPAPAVHVRPDPGLDRVRPDRQPHRPLQAGHPRRPRRR